MSGAKGTKVSQQEVKKMYDLFKQLGTYKAVAKKLRRNPDTVSRHIKAYEAALGMAQVLTQQ